MTKKPLSSIAQSKRRRSRHHISLPRMGKGDRVSGTRVLSLAAQMRLSFSCTTFYLSCHVCPIRPCGAPSPGGEGCDTRIPSSKQAAHHPCEPIRSPSTVIPSAALDLYCTAAICTHAPAFKRHLGASFFAFPSPTFYRSARKIPPLRSG